MRLTRSGATRRRFALSFTGMLITALKPEKLNLGSRYKTLDIAENGMALDS